VKYLLLDIAKPLREYRPHEIVVQAKMKIPDIQYSSPVIRYDPRAQVEIFERRDPQTGAVAFQTPSVQQVQRLEQNPTPTGSARAQLISVVV
jgi:hypothetical protein